MKLNVRIRNGLSAFAGKVAAKVVGRLLARAQQRRYGSAPTRTDDRFRQTPGSNATRREASQ